MFLSIVKGGGVNLVQQSSHIAYIPLSDTISNNSCRLFVQYVQPSSFLKVNDGLNLLNDVLDSIDVSIASNIQQISSHIFTLENKYVSSGGLCSDEMKSVLEILVIVYKKMGDLK